MTIKALRSTRWPPPPPPAPPRATPGTAGRCPRCPGRCRASPPPPPPPVTNSRKAFLGLLLNRKNADFFHAKENFIDVSPSPAAREGKGKVDN